MDYTEMYKKLIGSVIDCLYVLLNLQGDPSLINMSILIFTVSLLFDKVD